MDSYKFFFVFSRTKSIKIFKMRSVLFSYLRWRYWGVVRGRATSIICYGPHPYLGNANFLINSLPCPLILSALSAHRLISSVVSSSPASVYLLSSLCQFPSLFIPLYYFPPLSPLSCPFNSVFPFESVSNFYPGNRHLLCNPLPFLALYLTLHFLL